MNNWQPIETAPKNEIALFTNGKQTGEGCMMGLGDVHGTRIGLFSPRPTHWMPFPPPPNEQPQPQPQAKGEFRDTKTHHLKTWPSYFDSVKLGFKTFEIRKDDRGYNPGDTLVLQEFIPCQTCDGKGRKRASKHSVLTEHCCKDGGKYTGREHLVTVTYATDFGQPKGQIVMGVKPLPGHDLTKVAVVDKEFLNQIERWFGQALRQWDHLYDETNHEDDLDLKDAKHEEANYYRLALKAHQSLAKLNAGGEG